MKADSTVVEKPEVISGDVQPVAPVVALGPIIPTPSHEVSARKPLKVRFHVGKDFFRRFDLPGATKREAPIQVLHLYPTLAEWAGRTVPDNVNPRSHDSGVLKSAVAKQIRHTLCEQPEDFVLANRGSTLIAEAYKFDPASGDVELTIADPDNQGLADGATTDAVIAQVQTEAARQVLSRPDAFFVDLAKNEVPDHLKTARIHLEIFVGLDDRDRIAPLVGGPQHFPASQVVEHGRFPG